MDTTRDVAPTEMVDAVRAKLDEARIPCPGCGTPLVSARAFSAATGAYIGLVCRPCEALYTLVDQPAAFVRVYLDAEAEEASNAVHQN